MHKTIWQPGEDVTPTSGLPTLLDLAVQTGRAARFGGRTNGFWSVLQHELACRAISIDSYGYHPVIALWASMHDAHEAYTADVPSPWKPEFLRLAQAELDCRIYRDLLRTPRPSLVDQRIVKEIDLRSLAAEAQVLGVPRSEVAWSHVPFPRTIDLKIVRRVRAKYRCTINPSCAAVRDWVEAVKSDLEILRAAA